MRSPSFFIVGAPRCGTTAMYQYLREHPRIYLARHKDAAFFAEDFAQFRQLRELSDYLALFAGASDEHEAVGEASVYYLASKVAASNIRRFDEDAKLLVMVRNPIDLLYSLHGQLLATFHEDVEEFEEAWRLQADRRRGCHVPPSCLLPVCLQYADIGKLGLQLGRLLKVFPAEQVHVVVFDDFVSDTKRVYEDVLRFLGVQSDQRASFPRVNVNRASRSAAIGKLFLRPPPMMRRSFNFAFRMLGEKNYSRIRRLYDRTLTSAQERKGLSRGFRQEIANEFQDDVRLLSRILNRDLTYWVEWGG